MTETVPASAKKTGKPKAARSAAAKTSAKAPKPRNAKAAGAATVKAKKAPVAKTASANPASGSIEAAKPAEAKPKPAKVRSKAAATADDLKKIKGIGPTIEAKLNAAGINSFAQIAAWSTQEQADFAEQLSFAGRIEREDWVNQAKLLASGEATEFSRRVAKGEVASSAAKPRRGSKT
ncbi:hypothetical protein [Hoeflea ulvae]|uniref:NADH-quinone oxidoreductase subunit E n=1 Tax=Hoeflea ulvae TaxID=2983764 RepID=A0ABT3YIU6_9HYPH|nr:hypothetical protein [Hoeflea ulvae]MCY0095806.1 hypothetical protein [Hoeflea ulvae]